MSFLKLLLSGSLIFIVVTSSIVDEYDADEMNDLKYGFSNNVDPTNYNITLEIGDKIKGYFGQCVAKFRLHHETQIIKMHAKELSIHHLTLIDDKNRTYEFIMRLGKNIVTLEFNDTLLPGDYILSTRYWGNTDYYTNGMLNTSYINIEGGEQQFIMSRINALEVQRLFPCWNEPALKASFDISVSHPGNYIVLSNAREIEQLRFSAPRADEILWTRFFTARVTSPYLMGIVVAPFPADPVEDISIRCRQEAAPYLKLVDIVVKNLTEYFLDEWLDLRQDLLPKVDHVAIPAYPEDILTTLGLVLYREANIMYNQKLHSFVHKINAASLIARGMTHQYFANLISPSWWFYLWLNDGIVTLLATEALQQNFVEIRALDMLVVQMQHESLRLDVQYFMEPLVYNIDSTFKFHAPLFISYYIKAPVILRMLQHILGENTFHRGVSIYLDDNKYRTANLDDFWTAMQHALREESRQSTLKIADVMYTWTQRQRYPMLYVRRENSSFVKIAVQNINQLRSDNWFIPITMTQEKSLNFTSPENVTWLITIQMRIYSISYPSEQEDGWIIVNLQQSGYYRVRYETENWHKIAMYLNSQNYAKIHVLNRAQIIDDAFHFLMAQPSRLELNLFLELALYLSQETDFVAWYPMFKAFEYMSCLFPYAESTHIKSHIKPILEKWFFSKNKGTASRYDLSSSLRTEIERWRCTFDSLSCIADTVIMIEKDLKQENDTKRLPLREKEWIYSVGSTKINRSTWIKMFKMYTNKSNNEMLKYLTYSEDSDLIIYYMNMTLLKKKKEMDDRDRVNSFLSILERQMKNEKVFDYILANIGRIRPKGINIFVAFIGIINYTHSRQQLEKLRRYLESFVSESETTFTLIVKHEFFDQETPFLSSHDMVCESLIRKCVLGYVEKLILSIKMKIQSRLLEIAKVKDNFEILEGFGVE